MKKLLFIIFLFFYMLSFSQDLSLWAGLNIDIRKENLISSLQLENRHNFSEDDNIWLSRLTFKTPEKIKVGGGLVFKGNNKIQEFRFNQSLEYKYHRLLIEEIYFVEYKEIIPRIRYRIMPSFFINKKGYISLGIEPIINIGSSNQYRFYGIWNLKINHNQISLGYISELYKSRINNILILKYHINK